MPRSEAVNGCLTLLIRSAKGIYLLVACYLSSGGSRVRSKIAHGLLKARDLRSLVIGLRYDIPWRRPSWVQVPPPAPIPSVRTRDLLA